MHGKEKKAKAANNPIHNPQYKIQSIIPNTIFNTSSIANQDYLDNQLNNFIYYALNVKAGILNLLITTPHYHSNQTTSPNPPQNPSNYINHTIPTNLIVFPIISFLPLFKRPFQFNTVSCWPCHRWLHGPPPCCTAAGPTLHSSAAWHVTNFHPSRCSTSPRRPSKKAERPNGFSGGGSSEQGFLREWNSENPFVLV